MESIKTLGGELGMHIEGFKGQHTGKMSTASISSPSEATPLSGGPRTPERRQLRVLEALDQAKTQYYHVSAILIAGMGFYTDAYDLFCIPLVTRLLGRLYYPGPDPTTAGWLPIGVNAAVSGVALVGAFVGQIVFGWLGDKLGRKKAYGVTLGMMFVFSIASGFSMGRTPNGVITSLCFFRFWLGVGIGGDYPLSATIMAEYANTKTRGAFMAAVFAMQGLGILTGGIAGLALSYAFNKGYPSNPPSTVDEADFMWRILVMLGAIPAAGTFYYRMRMPETARYTALVKGNAMKAASDMTKVLKVPALGLSETAVKVRGGAGGYGSSEYGLMSREFLRNHGLHLLGTSSTWFLLDIAFYSQNLFQSTIFTQIGWTPGQAAVNGLREVYLISRAQIIVALCATVPGYFVTMFLVDHIGRKIIQLQGFIFMAIFMFAIAIRYNTLVDGSRNHVIIFLVLYSFTFFFANFGPNTTTFIIPAELFPARLRATCHGISAASGKVGAIVGAFGFLYASQDTNGLVSSPYPAGIGTKATFFILAAANIFGAAFTLLIPETKGRSLEEISKENEFDFSPYDKAGRGMRAPQVSSPSISIDTPDSHLYSKRSSTSRSINMFGTPDSLQPNRLSSASINTTDTQPKWFSGILNSPDNLQPKRPSASTSN